MKYTNKRQAFIALCIFFSLTFLILKPASAAATHRELEQIALKLELLRNQIDLATQNHGSLEKDIERQNDEITRFHIYQHIPIKNSTVHDSALLHLIQKNFALPLKLRITLSNLNFTSGWKYSKSPIKIAFNQNFKLSDSMLTQSRILQFTFNRLHNSQYISNNWFRNKIKTLPFLLKQSQPCIKKTKALICYASIYMYRDIAYPEFIAPDLSQYTVPYPPQNLEQEKTHKRILQYRNDIIKLWPQAQIYLNNIRIFALNNARIQFYLKQIQPME